MVQAIATIQSSRIRTRLAARSRGASACVPAIGPAAQRARPSPYAMPRMPRDRAEGETEVCEREFALRSSCITASLNALPVVQDRTGQIGRSEQGLPAGSLLPTPRHELNAASAEFASARIPSSRADERTRRSPVLSKTTRRLRGSARSRRACSTLSRSWPVAHGAVVAGDRACNTDTDAARIRPRARGVAIALLRARASQPLLI